MSPRHYNRSFTAKFNYFRAGFGVPRSQSLHYWILVSFLRFHYEFVPANRGSTIPVERALLPEKYVTGQQNHNVEQHLHKAEHWQIMIDQRPRIQKDRFDIEKNKQQPHHIELDGDRFASVAGWMDTAFIRLIFLPRPFVPPDQVGYQHQLPGQAHAQAKHQ